MAGVEEYFDGYAVAGDRLAALQVPVSVLASADDPVIPVDGFPRLALPAHSSLEIADFGGHCGFLEGVNLRGYAERWVAERLAAAAASARDTIAVSA
jgi:predicted alpha/beta-fold hydrolase